jgi:streptogramin lyase
VTRRPHRWLALTALVGAALCAPAAHAGTAVEFPTGTPTGGGVMTAGPDGNLWWAADLSDKIGRVTPAGKVTLFSQGITAGGHPDGITAGPDGNIWFTEEDVGKIGRMSPAGGPITQFSTNIPANAHPEYIAQGPDGAMWFTEFNGSVGRITTGGAVTHVSSGLSPGSQLIGIAPDSNGLMWATGSTSNKLVQIYPAGNSIVEYPTGVASGRPWQLASGPDGNIWFGDTDNPSVGRFEFETGSTSRYGAGFSDHPEGIAAGPDGNMWFVEQHNYVGRIATEVAAPASGNLLRNPDFEFHYAPTLTNATAPLVGWVTTPNMTPVHYGGTNLPTAPTAGNSRLVWGGPQNPESRAIQQVDVSAQAAGIDGGRATVALAGMLGGFANQNDRMAVTATYLSADEAVLGTLQIGPVTNLDRNGTTGLLLRSASGAVPPGTRAIRVVALATRAEGADNDSYMDDLSLTMAVKPVPPDTTPPVLDKLKAKPSKFAVGTKQTLVSSKTKKPKKPAVGTKLSYRLGEAATTTLTFDRIDVGRRKGTSCVKPTKSNAKAKHCNLYVRAGTLTRTDAAGLASHPFTGRIGKKALRIARYRLTATAKDAAGNVTVKPATFVLTIVKR